MPESSVFFSVDQATQKRFHLPARTVAGLLVAALAVIGTTALAYRSLRDTELINDRVARTLRIVRQTNVLLADLKDAETGQRGYLLTGADSYLAPYTAAQAATRPDLASLRSMVDDSPLQRDRGAALEPLVIGKLDELAETVAMRRAGNADAALAIVNTNRGKESMDQIRALIADMQAEERTLLASRQSDAADAVRASFYYTLLGAALLLVLILMAAVLLARSHREREIGRAHV